MQINKLTSAALLIAIGTLTAHIIYLPAGISKCFPVQHAINIIGAILLGPKYAISIAFIISCLRNLLGTGSLLAFPGSMIGALCAGLAYKCTSKTYLAILGEILGTGILGALSAWYLAKTVLNSQTTAWFFIPPFLVSTIGGSIIAFILLKAKLLNKITFGQPK